MRRVMIVMRRSPMPRKNASIISCLLLFYVLFYVFQAFFVQPPHCYLFFLCVESAKFCHESANLFVCAYILSLTSVFL